MHNKTILFVHQSSELYGSDKTLLYLVKSIKKTSIFNPIVVLPSDGPLSVVLKQDNIQVITMPVLKVSRKMFNLKNIFLLPFVAIKATIKLEKELKDLKIDLIHSNTLAVLLGALYARKKKIRHLWHVHEIIGHPKIISKAYPVIVDKFSDIVIYNSKASKLALCKRRKSLESKSQVIWNGLDREQPYTSEHQINDIRYSKFKAETNQTVIGLVGRINRWKGHLLLLESFNEVLKINQNVKLVFIGSTPPNQDFFKDILLEKIHSLNLEKHCEIIPFDTNIWPLYDSLDIVVVPSTEPEPFGLVAIEAMLSKKIVIVADHGGLSEIVQNNKTGFLFKPNDKEDLIRCLKKALENKDFLNEIAKQGFELAKRSFSLENYLTSFESTYLKILKD